MHAAAIAIAYKDQGCSIATVVENNSSTLVKRSVLCSKIYLRTDQSVIDSMQVLYDQYRSGYTISPRDSFPGE